MPLTLQRLLILSLSWFMLTACNVTTGNGADGGSNNSSEPLVVSLSPTIDAQNQALNSTVSIEFSTAMNPSTITSSSFTITPAVTGVLSFSNSNKTVTFTPDEPLAAGVTYTVTLSTAITDAQGNAISAKTYSFTTDSWQGVIQNGVTGGATSATTATFDADGNLWVAGHTTGDLNGEVGSGNVDIFLAEYSALGSHLRTVLITGDGNSYVNDIAFDSTGNLYVLGETTGDINGETVTGTTDSLLIKFDNQMNEVWTKLLGASGAETKGVRLTLTSSGTPYFVGTTTGDLGSGLNGNQDVFYAKAINIGNDYAIQRGQTGALNGSLMAGGILVDGGNVFVTGSTTVALDSQAKIGVKDGFITKLDTDFAKVPTPTKQFGGAGLEVEPSDVILDQDTYMVIVGSVTGQGTMIDKAVTDYASTFLTSYDSALTYRRTVVYSEANEYAGAVTATTDSDGNIYVAGKTTSALDDNTFSGTQDAFVIKYDPFYDKEWVSQLGANTGNTDGLAIAVDASGNTFVAGDTTAVLTGTAVIGSKDYFVAKFNASGVQQ